MGDLDHLFDPESLARRDDPATSHEAAQLSQRAISMRIRLLQSYVRHGAMCAEQAAAVAGYAPADGAWKRVSDLLRLGLLYDTGRTATASSGREQRILALTQKGWQEAQRGRQEAV